MALQRLSVANLRCIAAADLDLDPRRNLILGPNGAGKTSLLEAAHVLGRGHSFRVRDNRRLIRRGEAGFVVRGEFEQGSMHRRVGVGYEAGNLSVHIDGLSGRRASQLAEALPVEVIDPAAHSLVDGSPGVRRRFLDWGLFHVEPGYMTQWQNFRRVLVQRNSALRAGVSDAELEIWDESFVAAASALNSIREIFVARWAEQVHRLGERLLGRPIELEYRPGTARGVALAEALETGRARERERGLTQYGPHRSDVAVRLDGGLAREVASRGQQKLLAAALIIGRLADRIERSGTGGLLLVDDPAAELDRGALERLCTELDELPVQTILTAIAPDLLPPQRESRVFHVEQGVIEPA